MINKNNIPYYFIATGLFILLKFWYRNADLESLIFLLKPTDTLISIITGSTSVYQPETGYYHGNLNILIDKSCAGFNFWLLCSFILIFLSLKYFNRNGYKLLMLTVSFVIAFILTIFVNSSRIFASVVIQNSLTQGLPDLQNIVHQSIGIITNLSFLILLYYLSEKLVIKIKQNAKPA